MTVSVASPDVRRRAAQFPIYTVSSLNRPLSWLGQGFLRLAAQELAGLQQSALTGARARRPMAA
jgi:hypothetical protein